MGGPGMVGKWPWTVERTVRRVRAGWGGEGVGAYTPPGHFFEARRSNLRAGRGFGIGFLTKMCLVVDTQSVVKNEVF